MKQKRRRGAGLAEVEPLVYAGHATKEIAYRMKISFPMAGYYIQRFIHSKGVTSRIEVMALRIQELSTSPRPAEIDQTAACVEHSSRP